MLADDMAGESKTFNNKANNNNDMQLALKAETALKAENNNEIKETRDNNEEDNNEEDNNEENNNEENDNEETEENNRRKQQ